MTSATTASAKKVEATLLQDKPLIPKWAWAWVAVISLLFIAFHWAFLYRTLLIIQSDDNWSHALIVPFISIYFVYQQRDKIKQIKSRVCMWGLPIMLLGFFGYMWGRKPRS